MEIYKKYLQEMEDGEYGVAIPDEILEALEIGDDTPLYVACESGHIIISIED